MRLSNIVSSLPPWSLTAITVAAILYLTLMPHPLPQSDIPLFEGADKIVHAIMFGGLYLMMRIDASRRRTGAAGPGTAAWMAVAAVIFGGLIEVLQHCMRLGRSGDMADWIADTAGVLVMWGAVTLGRRWLRIPL